MVERADRVESRRRLIAAGAVFLLVAASLIATTPGSAAAATGGPGPIMQRSAANVTADALPTAQIDGVVWAQAIVGNTVYVGGSFAHARPAGVALGGAGTVTRANMMAYDLTTGVMTPFAPVFNAQVQALAVSPDGTRLIAAGQFTTVNGEVHNRIAEFDTATGALVPSFTAGLNAGVKALAVTDSVVYAGGLFTTANNVTRTRLAAFQMDTGALTGWTASADYTVDAMVLTPDGTELVVGGAFQRLNSVSVWGLGAVNAATGASVPWVANQTVYSYGTGAAFTSLSTDGTAVYGSAYNYYGTGNLEGAFSARPDTGVINWLEDCHGDTYDTFPVNGILYTVSHAHYCANLGGWGNYNPVIQKHSMAFTAQATGVLLADQLNDTQGYPSHAGVPSPSIINWFPDFTNGTYTGQNQAAWTLTGNSQYVVEGGEFPTVNGTAQQGLVRFAVPALAPRLQGPMLTAGHFVPSLSAVSGAGVRISFGANWDRDDMTLTYKIVRDGDTGHPIYTTVANSEWWNLPTMTFTDSGLTPNTTYRYRLYVSDGDGNTVAGDTASITTPSTAPTSTPVASFTASAPGLTASFDGRGSTDSGATITSYSWNYGDASATGSGSTSTHVYAQAGSYPVTLTVQDSKGNSASITQLVDVAGGAPVNRPPTASFTSSASGLTASFDGSASSDPDGTIASYAWDFGDGTTGTGQAPSHAYATGGTYTVTLTVTDNGGATGSVSHPVTVTAPPPPGVIAADSFGRTVTNGWGSADTGGAWSLNGSPTLFAVGGGVGTVTLAAAGSGPSAFLNSVSAADVDVTVDVSLNKPATGGGTFYAVAARHAGTTDYRAKVKVPPSGAVTLYLTKVVSGTETTLASQTVAGLVPAVNQTLRVEFAVRGTSPAVLTAGVWVAGSTPPASPQLTATDSTAQLQAAGGIGLWAYLSGSSTNAPVAAAFDNLAAH